jgi:hypothetical protein
MQENTVELEMMIVNIDHLRKRDPERYNKLIEVACSGKMQALEHHDCEALFNRGLVQDHPDTSYVMSKEVVQVVRCWGSSEGAHHRSFADVREAAQAGCLPFDGDGGRAGEGRPVAGVHHDGRGGSSFSGRSGPTGRRPRIMIPCRPRSRGSSSDNSRSRRRRSAGPYPRVRSDSVSGGINFLKEYLRGKLKSLPLIPIFKSN